MATTFQEIIDRARSRVDMTRSEFVDDPDWLEFARDAYRALYNFLTNSFQDYFVTTSADLTVAPDGTVNVPDDFGKLIAVDVKDGGRWKEIISASMHERNSSFLTILGITVPVYRFIKYRLISRKLWFFPIESSPAKIVRIWYVPLPEKVVETDEIPIEMEQWSRAMVLDCCCMACAKEETDPSQFLTELRAIRSEIAGEAMNRDMQRVDTIQDVHAFKDIEDWY